MAAVLETMKGEDRYFLNQPFFRVSPLQMQVEKAYGLFPVRPVQGKYWASIKYSNAMFR